MLTGQLSRLLHSFAKSQLSFGQTKISVSIIKGKKADKQLQTLKRSLMQKQPIKSQTLYDQYHHREVYQRIDTDLEAFFYKREYSLQNFNFLINLLGHQKKLALVPDVLSKMHLMRVIPDERTYNYMIRAAAETGDTAAAERFLEEAGAKFGVGKHFYTSLMQAYVKKNEPEMSYKILQEMIEKGIQPDLPVYTTLINAFRMGRKLEKCWQLNKLILRGGMQLDETYVGVMLKVYAATHDAEKAVKLYQQQVLSRGVRPMIQTVNSYFKALSTRPEYSVRVVDNFMNMVEHGEMVYQQTVRWALKACATTANVKSAVQIVKIMRLKEIQPNVQIYNSLIRVYANACSLPALDQSYRQMMLTDTWKILQQVIAKNMLDTRILNNVMLAYANALQQDKIQGLILPLFAKFGLEMDPYSYEVLVGLNYHKKDFPAAIKVWNQMKLKFQEKKQLQIAKDGVYENNLTLQRQDQRPTFNLMETYLQIALRMMDMPRVLEALDMFKRLKRHPKNSTLKFLGNLKNLPIEIRTSLMDFKIRFGQAKLAKTRSNSERSVKDPQNR